MCFANFIAHGLVAKLSRTASSISFRKSSSLFCRRANDELIATAAAIHLPRQDCRARVNFSVCQIACSAESRSGHGLRHRARRDSASRNGFSLLLITDDSCCPTDYTDSADLNTPICFGGRVKSLGRFVGPDEMRPRWCGDQFRQAGIRATFLRSTSTHAILRSIVTVTNRDAQPHPTSICGVERRGVPPECMSRDRDALPGTLPRKRRKCTGHGFPIVREHEKEADYTCWAALQMAAFINTASLAGD